MQETDPVDLQTLTSPVAGGGEMGKLMREFDWAQTPLGRISSWSPSLKMIVRFLLANRFPMLLWWGPQFCQLYNDPYRPVLGTKHPNSIGQPASECWPEIWEIIGPLIETPFNGGPATWMVSALLDISRIEMGQLTIERTPVDLGMLVERMVAEIPQLFQRFYRAGNVDPHHIPGMGIGLFVVKEIVALHGGMIEVESDEANGTTFTLWLPLARAAPHAPA